MLKMGRPIGHFAFNMGITLPERAFFYIETGPGAYWLSHAGFGYVLSVIGRPPSYEPVSMFSFFVYAVLLVHMHLFLLKLNLFCVN